MLRALVTKKKQFPALRWNHISVVLPTAALFTDRAQKKTAELALLICVWVIVVAANEAPRK
jgi:predicted metalloenzyme YecM